MVVTVIGRSTHGCGETDTTSVIPAIDEPWADVAIDICLIPIVNALNDKGAYTRACCCGHGAVKGNIILHDGTMITLERCQQGY